MASFLSNHAPWRQLVTLNNIRLVEISEGDPVMPADGVSVKARWRTTEIGTERPSGGNGDVAHLSAIAQVDSR